MSSQHPILDSSYSWLRLGLTLIAALIANAGMWMVIAVLPAIETDFGAARASASMPYTTVMIGFALGNLVVGRLVDRFGIVMSLQGAGIILAATFAVAMLAGDLLQLSLVHLILGMGGGVGFGPMIADISHWFDRRRGVAVAIAASGNYLSGVVWPMVLSGTLESDGWRAVYLVLAIASLTLIPLSFLFRRKLPSDAQAAADAGSTIRAASTGLSPRALGYLLGLAGVACCVAMSMPQVHIVAYCVGLGYGPAVGHQMLSLMLFGGVVSRIASGLLADRLGGVRTVLLGSVLQCIALLLYLPYDGLVSLYVISAIFGLSQGGIVPSYAIIVREYMPAREAGTRVGFVMMMTILGMAIGGWASGWIYDLTGSYAAAFFNGIAFNGLNIAILFWLISRTRPRQHAMA